MFNRDFFPTPAAVIDLMTNGEDLTGKHVLEPSAGKGDIVDYCISSGAGSVTACEIHPDLKKILSGKCRLIADDFLKVTADQVSHMDYIVMNPPFSADEKHILHAWEIAPAGCKVIALCNLSTVKNKYYRSRQELNNIIDQYGNWEDLGKCFDTAERKTLVEVAMIKIQKPASSYESEFSGFFLDEEPEQIGENGIMSYNFVRDLVNRYTAAIKLYDEQLNTAAKMNSLLSNFYGSELTFTCTEDKKPLHRNEFKKGLQKAGWAFIFEKMDLQRYSTRGLKEDINKFVEQQSNVPFTMRNIYRMIEIVIGTTSQRIDRAILEVFEKLTKHHADNHYRVEGWKTNSHYLLNRRFIFPNIAKSDSFTSKSYGTYSIDRWGHYGEYIIDLEKALCYLTGDKWDDISGFSKDAGKYKHWGEWFDDHHFFKYKGFKKGTMHFEFKDENIWGKFNQRVAKLLGYPLFEGKEQTDFQKRQTGRTFTGKQQSTGTRKPGPKSHLFTELI